MTNTLDTNATNSCHVRLLHHGAAAANTSNGVLWFRDSRKGATFLVYASHRILTFARRVPMAFGDDGGTQELVWRINETLRSEIRDAVITCIDKIDSKMLACGFSDGSISLWRRQDNSIEWQEHVLDQNNHKRSIKTLSLSEIGNGRILIVSGSSAGAMTYKCEFKEGSLSGISSGTLVNSSVCSVRIVDQTTPASFNQNLILVGTAAPRQNKIHVWHLSDPNCEEPTYSGSLFGHEDWVSCFAWSQESKISSLLASGSQDNKIRLWKFVIRSIDASEGLRDDALDLDKNDDGDNNDDDEDDDDNALLELEEEGESRLEVVSNTTVTSVFLEALLLGHEAAVTSVEWHPNPLPIYGQESLLISSSMDRLILLWTPSVDGIWTPLTRVGSVGGILGGSVGSTLLGYQSAIIEPDGGRCMVGVAYGGSVHVWSLLENVRVNGETREAAKELSTLVNWAASPGITGHFAGVTDLCWESSQGRYLLTVSNDQTCRLWASLKDTKGSPDEVWLELARPQVHGYDLSAITSVSSQQLPHRIISGADEKELRVFDAPLSTLRLLKQTSGSGSACSPEDHTQRVERAYIPSLGLSNKATASEGAEEDHEDVLQNDEGLQQKIHLPLERDLGAESIWPEVQKLFGHNTELYCLASTCGSQTSGSMYTPTTSFTNNNILVASSAKARDPEAAAIRIWDLATNKCIQTLTGGHKSTVATLSFSPDGQYLVSSGKDRRLCLWKRAASEGDFALVWTKDSAHKRIIWSVHVCPFNENVFASGSRDGCVNLWMIKTEGGVTQPSLMCTFAPRYQVDGKPDSVTAVCFAPRQVDTHALILAVGLESGRIELWSIFLDKEGYTGEAKLYFSFPTHVCHSASVSKLAWQPCQDPRLKTQFVLASCSMDHGCRLYSIDLSNP